MRTYTRRDVITADQQASYPAPARRFDTRERADLSGVAPRLGAKLAVPHPPSGQVARPRLGALLDAGTRGRLTLLTAPAGWGKTALLSAWLRARNPAGPVCWLTADETDKGARFWLVFYAGLKASGATGLACRPGTSAQNGGPIGLNAGPGLNRPSVAGPHNAGPYRQFRAVGSSGQFALPLPGLGPDDVFLARLADGLAQLREPVVVVLDDFHTVQDPAVLAGLGFLLRHPATKLRLVISTRVEPALALHRWRLGGEITEIRPDELAFTPGEAAELLAAQGLALPDQSVRRLHEHAEGWPAGLRLAALCLRTQPATVEGFAGDRPGVVEYLLDAGLNGQPEELVDALLSCCVLDRVCGRLLDTLTGRTDGEQVLATLERTHGLLVPLGGRRTWYRLRRLFAEALRAELRRRAPERIPHLHRLAATWCAGHELPVDALRHALAAGDHAHATRLLTGQWHELIQYGHPGLPAAPHAEPSDDATPDDATPDDVVRADPELALACAADRLGLGDLAGADRYLRLAQERRHLVVGERAGGFAPMLTAFQMILAHHAGDTGGALSSATRLLTLVEQAVTGPKDDSLSPDVTEQRDAMDSGGQGRRWSDERARALALAAAGTAQFRTGDLNAAAETLGIGLAAAERAGLVCPQLTCLSGLALLRAVHGELRLADKTARAALSAPPCHERCGPHHHARAYLARAVVHFEWDRLDRTERYLELALAVPGPASDDALDACVAVLRARLCQARGDLPGAGEVLRAARDAAGDTGLKDDSGVRVQRWYTAAEAVALARTCLRDADPDTATRVLSVWTHDETATPLLPLRLEAGLITALAARRVGDGQRACRALEQVLRLAGPEGFRRVFTQDGPVVRELLIDHLNTATAHWATVTELIEVIDEGMAERRRPSPPLGEALTEREMTVLRYLQGTLSTGEIASELFVSVNTIKTHVRNIYRKLEAGRRREAVRKARELHIL
jgi:LuxR family maltose regulon positive regulatory protein